LRRFATRGLVISAISLAIIAIFAPTSAVSPGPTPALAAPQDPLVAEFNRRQNLYNARRYFDVIQQAAEFLEQMRSRYGEDSNPFELAENMIISSHVLSNRRPEAVPYLEHKLARLQASGSENSLDFTLCNLGGAYSELGRFSEAEPLDLRVLA